jgi:hypothetical protein
VKKYFLIVALISIAGLQVPAHAQESKLIVQQYRLSDPSEAIGSPPLEFCFSPNDSAN